MRRKKLLKRRVMRVIDGDTIDVNFCTKRIRIHGYDTPEIDEKFYHQARKYLSKLILFRKVSLQIVTVDVYGRYVAKVFYKDKNIAEYMASFDKSVLGIPQKRKSSQSRNGRWSFKLLLQLFVVLIFFATMLFLVVQII